VLEKNTHIKLTRIQLKVFPNEVQFFWRAKLVATYGELPYPARVPAHVGHQPVGEEDQLYPKDISICRLAVATSEL